MISLYCGDNTVASRDAYISEKAQYLTQGKQIHLIDASTIDEILKSGGSDALDLFSGAPVYETTNLISALRKKYNRKAKDELRKIASDVSIQLLDWENKSAYDLGIDKDKFAFVQEYKLGESTFTLLPTLTPGKKSQFLTKLALLEVHQPIEVTFAMIVRHIKLMTAYAYGENPTDSPYLLRIAHTASSQWTKEALLKFYKQLLRIDINVKTGRNTPLSLREQLEILVSLSL